METVNSALDSPHQERPIAQRVQPTRPKTVGSRGPIAISCGEKGKIISSFGWAFLTVVPGLRTDIVQLLDRL